MNEVLISKEEMQTMLKSVFLKYSFTEQQADTLSSIHTESTLDGISSHGINRIPVFIDYVRRGLINIEAIPEKIAEMGSMERWDGNLGSGVLNAITATERAISLAKNHGMGLVALRNTNHWMRGGTYGWQAANQDCIAIMFTNTTPNMPAWGGKHNRIGNNPLVIAIPRKEGHIVLDMAMSQFSFGKMESLHLKNETLPFNGGWDSHDQLSKNPKDIIDSGRAIPVGYWKGSALSMILDMLATLLSAGNSTFKIGQKGSETAISQVFLCIDPSVFSDKELQEELINEIIAYTKDVDPMKKGGATFYPGERTLAVRAKNRKEGIKVSSKIWNEILALAR
ncbi:3-dehydro-L-gulonate 2-dehydrogenase [Maribacter sedimenticola]|uniref:3-dehydro-L-gulonate 2-dehydrogenase n=1 Tax=Maribacter sedimenticola TaxID=228956 RepID=A0ABY1SCR6_9FLAO|nr:3-dehydro-L-gulonate 2-dehydrogenase [Maribacter sedimenticola]SNR26901.1 3-dehydro-L-gulonate 2-dehydrogenase [Maribacter sedimenticola]